MGNHLHLWQRIHVIPNLTTNSFANMLHIIKSFDDPIIINAKEKGTTQAIGKSAYAFQPTLRFLLFKHYLVVVCSAFADQIINFHIS